MPTRICAPERYEAGGRAARRRDRAQPLGGFARDSTRTTSATDATMIPAPSSVTGVIASPRLSQPNAIATTGLTYAYVETLEIGAFWSSQAYDVKASSEPKVI